MLFFVLAFVVEQVDRFADGEVNVMVKENVRGKDVYIIQPTCMPVNENLVELLLMVSCSSFTNHATRYIRDRALTLSTDRAPCPKRSTRR